MNARRLTFIGAVIAICGCGTQKPQPSEQRYGILSPEAQRAFEQERRAGLVIWFEDTTDIRLRIPPSTDEQPPIREEQLQEALSRVSTDKSSAVLVMGKPMRLLPDDLFKQKVDAIDAILRHQGFQRVIVQLAAGFGRPIYRE